MAEFFNRIGPQRTFMLCAASGGFEPKLLDAVNGTEGSNGRVAVVRSSQDWLGPGTVDMKKAASENGAAFKTLQTDQKLYITRSDRVLTSRSYALNPSSNSSFMPAS
jgi:hypothetical protein